MISSTLTVSRATTAAQATGDLPWWRYAMVWLVIAGPLAVVVASFVTLGIAWMNIDPVISDAPSGAQQRVLSGSTAPAQLARNHAATPQK